MPLNHSLLCPNLKEWAKDNSSWKHTAVQHKEEKENSRERPQSMEMTSPIPACSVNKSCFSQEDGWQCLVRNMRAQILGLLVRTWGQHGYRMTRRLVCTPLTGKQTGAHFRKIDKKEDRQENFSHLSAAIAPGHVGNLAGPLLRPVFCPFFSLTLDDRLFKAQCVTSI